MIRIGILGAAKIAPAAIIEPASRRDDCTIQAVAASDPGKARAYARQHGIPEVADSYDALLQRDDVDLIYNALPPHRHADLSIAALKAGKPVLCEKPFAMNAGQAQEMVTAARAANLPLFEAFHYRFHPAFLRVLEVIRSGELGPVRTLEGEFTVAIPYREGELRHTLEVGGGALMDLGCYPVHQLRTVTGEEPVVVSAECLCEHEGVDLTTHARLDFPSGASGAITTSMSTEVPRRIILIVRCANGTLTYVNPVQPHLGHEIRIQHDGRTVKESLPGGTTYDYQLAHVVDVLAGKAKRLTGGADAVANMVVIDAIYRAGGLRPRGT
ncbi:MAG TPA: Gfo/Idh/MocA family oxidoreductase [Hyphomonas sp.]|nr:Gfo/Idh/MocA family oxidoreductase [Hyphomonas sp.]MCA8905008.1 Gfo/Idh/MocA family oxidoreductase [Hyphomonas sp.]MCB9962451.1 Gfo/Idh/MocA family oxidoreductase [Hyphomonas sp.]MCB9972097.1 Gfo/Idh/MocA family oxidoreductase [Hyphomonas sp.]HPE47712.1 Gfo/Idh/MocA family oxidoreductase [Hyphomonas sp.]